MSEGGWVKMPASHSSVYLFHDRMKITLHLIIIIIIINRYETIPIFVLLLLLLMIKPKTERDSIAKSEISPRCFSLGQSFSRFILKKFLPIIVHDTRCNQTFPRSR